VEGIQQDESVQAGFDVGLLSLRGRGDNHRERHEQGRRRYGRYAR